jgi:hypothetical protein
MNEGLADDVDAEAEEVLNELNLLTESEDAQNDMRAAGNLDLNKFVSLQKLLLENHVLSVRFSLWLCGRINVHVLIIRWTSRTRFCFQLEETHGTNGG